MLLDTVRPPSLKKKRHLVLKWVSGIVLLLELLRPRARQRRARGDELGDPVSQEAGVRLQEPGVLQDRDMPEAREADLPADGGLCYPLETAKGLKKAIDALCHLP